MEPALVVSLFWSLFAAAHVGLATGSVRSALTSRFGEFGFTLAFSGVAALLFAPLVLYYGAHRFEGAAGLALGAYPLARAALIVAVVCGIVLMTASFASYGGSPYAVLGAAARRQPRGLERVTRHPFFMGLGLFSLAHTLLATRLVGAAFMAGFALLAIGGSAAQDRKLLATRGEPFAAYLAETSATPLAAILSGRQRLVWGELPLGGLLLGAAIAVALRAMHDGIFAYDGALFVAITFAGSGSILAQSIAGRRRAERRAVKNEPWKTAPTPARR